MGGDGVPDASSDYVDDHGVVLPTRGGVTAGVSVQCLVILRSSGHRTKYNSVSYYV